MTLLSAWKQSGSWLSKWRLGAAVFGIILLLAGLSAAQECPAGYEQIKTGFGSYCAPVEKRQDHTVVAPLTIAKLSNMNFRLEDGSEVQLTDGKGEAFSSNGKENYVLVKDKIAFGDLDGDGVNDAVVVLASSSGGSGIFCHLIAVTNRNGKAIIADAKSLGDRPKINSITIEHGVVTVDMLAQGPNDPMCCPTTREALKLTLQKNRLVDLQAQSQGNPQSNGAPQVTQTEPVNPRVSSEISALLEKAKKGDAVSEGDLGYAYLSGEGIQKNEAEGFEWTRKAAMQGAAFAESNLGHCYAEGLGVPKDNSRSAYWFRKSAQQGYADAQYNLGLCYKDGNGVDRDPVQARHWFHEAAEQGNEDAQKEIATAEDVRKQFASNTAMQPRFLRQGIALFVYGQDSTIFGVTCVASCNSETVGQFLSMPELVGTGVVRGALGEVGFEQVMVRGNVFRTYKVSAKGKLMSATYNCSVLRDCSASDIAAKNRRALLQIQEYLNNPWPY